MQLRAGVLTDLLHILNLVLYSTLLSAPLRAGCMIPWMLGQGCSKCVIKGCTSCSWCRHTTVVAARRILGCAAEDGALALWHRRKACSEG